MSHPCLANIQPGDILEFDWFAAGGGKPYRKTMTVATINQSGVISGYIIGDSEYKGYDHCSSKYGDTPIRITKVTR